MARGLAACFICTLMLIPVLIVNAASGTGVRMALVVMACSASVLVGSSFTNAKTGELFVGGAT